MDENGQRAIDHAEGTLNSKVIEWHKLSACQMSGAVRTPRREWIAGLKSERERERVTLKAP